MQTAIPAKREALAEAALERRLAAERVDVTLPVQEGPETRGRIHPISQVIDELTAIFADMGFSVAEGPDIETDELNFTALNFPAGHPAGRCTTPSSSPPDENGERKVLRTHTSPVQIRTMRSQQPPIRVIIPGGPTGTIRSDPHADVPSGRGARHRSAGQHRAHEVDSRGVLQGVLRGRPGQDALPAVLLPLHGAVREVDIQCSRKGGEIRFGEGADWLEILGCGMVHPNVLRNCGLDPDEYQGFAWGMGIDRIAMLKYGMPDLRPFFEADVRWLNHYGFRPLDIPSLVGGLTA